MIFTPKNFLLACLFLALSAGAEATLANKVSASVNASLGGRFDLSYERRFSDIFGLEAGAEIGEDSIKYAIMSLDHMGPFAAANLYVTNKQNNHQFYFSPRIHLAFGELSTWDPDNPEEKSKKLSMTALRASIFVIYRYILPFQMTLEAGLGVDAMSMLIPFERSYARSWHFLASPPKIHLGIGYAF